MNSTIQTNIIEKSDLNWQEWLKHGDQYMKAGIPKNKKSRFSTDIRYNLLSMSLESYIMAMTDYHNNLPYNHTYTELIEGLERVMTIDQDLKKRILQYENIQSICSIEKYHRNAPTENELDGLGQAVAEISAMAHKTCV